MGELDDIKRKLNIDKLDKDYRNKMYNKFVQKGGKAYEENKSKSVQFNRDKQILYKEVEQKKRELLQKKYSQPQQSSNKFQQQNKNKNKPKRYFSVFLTGFFQRIFTLSKNINRNFSYEMHQILPEIISELHSSIDSFLNANTERKWKNVEIINNIDPNGYEILIRINNLFKQNRNDRISNFFNFTNNIVCPQIIDDLNTLFKELFIIYPCWETSKDIIFKAEQLNNDNTSSPILLQKVKINKYIDKIYSYFFPRILTILNYNFGKKISYDYHQIKGFVKLNQEEELGSITKNLIVEKKKYIEKLKKDKEDTIKKLHDEIDKKDMEKIPKYILKGLKIIDEVIDNKEEFIKNESKLKALAKNEKMLDIYCIIQNFDIEYSFIMTTSQIIFNPKIESGQRIDMKSDLESLYIRYNEINSSFKEYFELTNQLIKLRGTSSISKSFTNPTIENLDKKRYIIFIETKKRASSFFKKFAIIMQTIIQDYNSEKKLLENPEERLHFESPKNRKQKLEDITVINAILLAFSYSSGINYYLSTEKIMSKGLFFEKEKNKENTSEENNDTKT